LKESENKDQNARRALIKGLILNMTRFGAKIHLNETVRFGKNSAMKLSTYKKKKKREKKQKRCRCERHHMSSSSPGRAENRGRRFFFSPLFLTDSLSPLNLKKTPNQPVAYHPPAGAPVYPALSPDRTEAGHFHRPSLPINTEAEKRHGDNEKREGQDKGGDTREKNRRERAEKRRERRREWEARTKKNKEEKTREEEKESRGEKREGPPPGATAVSAPAPPQATASATAGHRKRQRRSSSTPSNLLLLFCPRFLVFIFICMQNVN
jgi:hypothetical protein